MPSIGSQSIPSVEEWKLHKGQDLFHQWYILVKLQNCNSVHNKYTQTQIYTVSQMVGRGDKGKQREWGTETESEGRRRRTKPLLGKGIRPPRHLPRTQSRAWLRPDPDSTQNPVPMNTRISYLYLQEALLCRRSIMMTVETSRDKTVMTKLDDEVEKRQNNTSETPIMTQWRCHDSEKLLRHGNIETTNCTRSHTYTHPFNGPLSGTTRVSQYHKGKNQSGFYWSKRQWVAVASARPCASLHLAPER